MDGRTNGRTDGRTDGNCLRRADLPRENIAALTSRAKKSPPRLPARKTNHVFIDLFLRETVFCVFCPVFEELGFFGLQNRILHEISLRFHQISSKSELSLGSTGP